MYEDFRDKSSLKYHLYINPQKTGGGAKWPAANLKRYISGTECPIDLKPGCKFKFLSCLEVYLRKLINLDHEGALEGPFLPTVLQNLPRRIHFGVPLGVHEGPGGSSGPLWGGGVYQMMTL